MTETANIAGKWTAALERLVRWCSPDDLAQRELQRDQLMLAVKAAERMRPALYVAILGIGGAVLRWHGPEMIVPWLVFSLLVVWLGGHMTKLAARYEHDLVAFPQIMTLHLAANMMGTIAIASAGPLFWVSGVPENHLFILLMLTAAASTGIISQAPFAPGYAIHGLLLATSAVLCLTEWTAAYAIIATLIAAMSAMLIAVGASINEGAVAMLKLRQSERQLVEELREANRAKSEFLANMSHELRTPLNAILGFSEMMRDQVFGALGHQRYREYAGDIHGSGHHLLSLINDILDVAKIEAGQVMLKEDELDLGMEMNEALGFFHLRAESEGVLLELDAPNGISLRADRRALKQILANLVSNAIKFTPEGGNVMLGAHLVPEGDVHLIVADTGCGIATQDHERVFNSFGQGRHDVVAKDRGTGLGLTIVRGLVEAHGGTIGLTSEVGEGTTITVILPAERVSYRQRPRAAA